MDKTQLGGTGIYASPLMIGCWSFGGGQGSYWGVQEQSDVDALVGEALDIGVNFFDTAFGYNDGASEISLGKALAGRRGEAVICNKIQVQPREKLGSYRNMIEESLKRLGADAIDLMMIHWPVADAALLRANFEALLDVRERGLVREIGVSNFALGALALAKECGVAVAANEFAYSLMSRGIEREILPSCHESGIGVLAYMPLMQGVLAGKYASVGEVPPMRRRTVHFSGAGNPESKHGLPGADLEAESLLAGLREVSRDAGIPCGRLAVAWLLQKPGVASAIVGCRNAEQLVENAQAAQTRLPPDVALALDGISKPLMDKLGDHLDIWQPLESSRIW
ncbi:MAG: aldo/keto reductase [Clostridiales bacterium]|jgi:aryl-alcohol dehydrogenase-like predicted oxidoreductase|nr:aldo/keto reductase [Clostridiales bacterium]